MSWTLPNRATGAGAVGTTGGKLPARPRPIHDAPVPRLRAPATPAFRLPGRGRGRAPGGSAHPVSAALLRPQSTAPWHLDGVRLRGPGDARGTSGPVPRWLVCSFRAVGGDRSGRPSPPPPPHVIRDASSMTATPHTSLLDGLLPVLVRPRSDRGTVARPASRRAEQGGRMPLTRRLDLKAPLPGPLIDAPASASEEPVRYPALRANAPHAGVDQRLCPVSPPWAGGLTRRNLAASTSGSDS